jgi:hypothetical protein
MLAANKNTQETGIVNIKSNLIKPQLQTGHRASSFLLKQVAQNKSRIYVYQAVSFKRVKHPEMKTLKVWENQCYNPQSPRKYSQY